MNTGLELAIKSAAKAIGVDKLKPEQIAKGGVVVCQRKRRFRSLAGQTLSGRGSGLTRIGNWYFTRHVCLGVLIG